MVVNMEQGENPSLGQQMAIGGPQFSPELKSTIEEGVRRPVHVAFTRTKTVLTQKTRSEKLILPSFSWFACNKTVHVWVLQICISFSRSSQTPSCVCHDLLHSFRRPRVI